MRFGKYIKDKINYILAFIIYCMLVLGYCNAMQADKNIVINRTVFTNILLYKDFYKQEYFS